MAKRGGLGKGLDSLIPIGSEAAQMIQTDENPKEKITVKTAREKNTEQKKTASTRKNPNEYKDFLVKISKVEPNPNQPRKDFNQESLEELAESIKEHGIIQPLVVVKKDNHYEIVSGERRWRAANIAGLKSVPVIVKNLEPQELMEIALIENVQREDLNPLEEASGYQKLMETFNLKQEDVAKKVGKSRAAVANAIRLLKLDDSIQSMLLEKKISIGHARALLSLESLDDQYDVATRIVEDQLSVRETEELIKTIKEKAEEITDTKEINTAESSIEKQKKQIYKEYEQILYKKMGTKVRIKQGKNEKGKIEIEYFSLDEFERLLNMLENIPEEVF